MSGDLGSDFSSVYRRLFEAAGVQKQTELATALGVAQSNISRARKRGKIPESWLLQCQIRFSVNPLWILYGDKYQRKL